MLCVQPPARGPRPPARPTALRARPGAKRCGQPGPSGSGVSLRANPGPRLHKSTTSPAHCHRPCPPPPALMLGLPLRLTSAFPPPSLPPPPPASPLPGPGAAGHPVSPAFLGSGCGAPEGGVAGEREAERRPSGGPSFARRANQASSARGRAPLCCPDPSQAPPDPEERRPPRPTSPHVTPPPKGKPDGTRGPPDCSRTPFQPHTRFPA